MARIDQQLNAPMILGDTLNGLPLSYPVRQLHLNNEAEMTKLKAHVALQKISESGVTHVGEQVADLSPWLSVSISCSADLRLHDVQSSKPSE